MERAKSTHADVVAVFWIVGTIMMVFGGALVFGVGGTLLGCGVSAFVGALLSQIERP